MRNRRERGWGREKGRREEKGEVEEQKEMNVVYDRIDYEVLPVS